MNTPKPDNIPQPEGDQDSWTETESLNAMNLIADAVGDTTIRPMRSGILRQIRPDQPRVRPGDPEGS